MIFQAFTIFDHASQSYSPPFFQSTKGLAIRMFSDMAKNPDTSVGQHPTDFHLFHTGTYDDETGMLYPMTSPDPIIKASETLEQ